MNPINDAHVVTPADEQHIRERAVKLRFSQQMSYGIGAAMVFGLISALAHSFLGSVTTAMGAGMTSAAILPVLGLVGIAAVGAGCIFLSAKYLTETVQSEQVLQAKRISEATRYNTTTLTPSEPSHKTQFPASLSVAEDAPANQQERTDSITPRAELSRTEATNDTRSWVERAQTEQPQTTAARA